MSHPLLGHFGDKLKNMATESSRSWFCVWNNPQNHLPEGLEPHDMVNLAVEMWIADKPQRTCAINYEIGDSGTPHMHMVLEDPAKSRFSALQKLYPGIHIAPTKGTKEQAEDYINKRGRFEEKNHTVIVKPVYHGQIKAHQGISNDLDIISDLIERGRTPNEIFDIDLKFRKYDKIVKDAFYRKRSKDTGYRRTLDVQWHFGGTGTGKTYNFEKLIAEHGRDSVYFVGDYHNGNFDAYCAEPILFLDEFRGQIPFGEFLGLLDVYVSQVHARYSNVLSLWDTVYITSPLAPDEVYSETIKNRKDSFDQLRRRLTSVHYHYKEDGEYLEYVLPGTEFKSALQMREHPTSDVWMQPTQMELPWE